VLTADEGVSMTTSTASGAVWTMTLRRQRARTVDGNPDGYTNAFEIICSDCGDDPRQDYQDVSARLRRLRGPYLLGTGVTQYEAHIAWHEAPARAR
jgi:hypothetical protein